METGVTIGFFEALEDLYAGLSSQRTTSKVNMYVPGTTTTQLREESPAPLASLSSRTWQAAGADSRTGASRESMRSIRFVRCGHLARVRLKNDVALSFLVRSDEAMTRGTEAICYTAWITEHQGRVSPCTPPCLAERGNA